jgi:hypothetical protein
MVAVPDAVQADVLRVPCRLAQVQSLLVLCGQGGQDYTDRQGAHETAITILPWMLPA